MEWGLLGGIFPGGGHNQIFPSTQQGKPLLLYVIMSFLQVGFCFQYQLINLVFR